MTGSYHGTDSKLYIRNSQRSSGCICDSSGFGRVSLDTEIFCERCNARVCKGINKN